MSSVTYSDILKLAAPETILAITSLVVLGCDLVLMRRRARSERVLAAVSLASLGCLAGIVWLMGMQPNGQLFDGLLRIDTLGRLVKAVLLTLTIFTLLISSEHPFSDHIGEYFALVLMAAIGMLFLVSSEDILMIFISLELTSLSLYILTAFNKEDIKSAEAALKYFVFGGMSAAFTLFGLSLLYGFAGSTSLRVIATAASAGAGGLDPLLAVGLVMTIIGFGFKIAAVPFHLWAPDAYQGAPTPSAAFIASGSKVASFVVFAKVLYIGFAGSEGSASLVKFVPGWIPLLAAIAGLSLVIGNLAAIVQTSVKRLLAYSAVAHSGYVLVGMLARDEAAMTSMIYYISTYSMAVIGAFGVVAVVEKDSGTDTMGSFAGLYRRAPLLAFCLMIFLLSLAGIPPLAGFFGKFYLFAAALGSSAKGLGFLWLVVLAIAMSAVSLYYYLQVLKEVYVIEPAAGAPRIRASGMAVAAIAILAGAVVLLGCAPALLVDKLNAAMRFAGL